MLGLTKAINLAAKLIMLDRDGVINYDSVHYIRTPAEWQPIPGSLEAIVRLKKAGFRVAVATNQSGIGRGYYSVAMLESIHQKMQAALAAYGVQIDVIFSCPHLPSDCCECRKPKPGLLKKISDYFQCELYHVPFIGDNLSDVNAALAVDATPILLTSKDKNTLGLACFTHLSEAVDAILGVA